MKDLAATYDFVEIIYTYDINGNIIHDKNMIWDNAYKNCQKDDEVYIKFDDDIVFFEETLFTDFLKYRIDNPEIPLLYPTIINNAYFSWLLEKNNIYNHMKHYFINKENNKINLKSLYKSITYCDIIVYYLNLNQLQL